MFFWLRIKWIAVKVALITTRHEIRRSISRSKNRLLAKASRAAKKVHSAKKRTARTTKDLAIRSLPGVSKVKLPQPPFPHLIKSNRPPTEAQELVIRRAIDKAKVEQKQLQDLLKARLENEDGQVHQKSTASTRAWEGMMKHKIGQAGRFVKQQQALLSPLRRLPPELLQEIFKWAIPSVQQIHARWRFPADIPWALGQVCHSWRTNALAVSELWSYLPNIQLLRKSPRKTGLQMQYLLELLKRSGGAPLELYVHSRAFEGIKHPIIDLLCAYAERWEVATFELAPLTLLSGFKSVKGRISKLRSLSLQTRLVRDMMEMEGPFEPLDLFEDAPKLEVVSVSGPSFADILLPFDQLVHYKERLIFGNRIERVVSSELLESLTVLELTDDAVFPTVTMPKLKKLQVKFQYRPQYNCFDNLSLPSVEDIRVVSYRGNLMVSLIKMLAKSGGEGGEPCQLKTLSARSEFLGPGELRRVLLLTPELKSLDVTLPLYPRDLLDLAEGYQGKVMVPKLETCAFHLEDFASGDEMANALNQLGTIRCSSAASGSIEDKDITLLANDNVDPTRMSLTLYCDGSDWIHSQQATLEGWIPSLSSEKFNELREALEIKFPDLGFGRATGPRWVDVVGMWGEKVGKILAGVETLQAMQFKEGMWADVKENLCVGNVDEIYCSRILYPLKALADSKVSSLAAISERCRAILDKWQPILQESIKERHWAFKGPYALAYVADDDELRKDKEDVMEIVYGLKDPTSFTAAFWPMFMAR
ncbi:hypothetical protein CPB84DRAFT_1744457 [Gymnopilus junonius]|uniref:F-box domain-containing protein n=1 Tax=Gymnopilus junonius TaxID=109634 RepID=A0A9P5NVB1_GYMJU|nr:hypothetical protein CPB84DRAFT_1744457 [Gymnopilus junonius]